MLKNRILAKNQSCTKSHVRVHVGASFFQRSEVDNSSPVLKSRRFTSVMITLQISRAPPCSFLESLIANFDFIAGLDAVKIQQCVNSKIVNCPSNRS